MKNKMKFVLSGMALGVLSFDVMGLILMSVTDYLLISIYIAISILFLVLGSIFKLLKFSRIALYSCVATFVLLQVNKIVNDQRDGVFAKYDVTYQLLVKVNKELSNNVENCKTERKFFGVDIDEHNDPYTGAAFKYIKNGRCTVYSVGPDNVDDNALLVIERRNLIYHPNSKLWDLILIPELVANIDHFREKWKGDIVYLSHIEDE